LGISSFLFNSIPLTDRVDGVHFQNLIFNDKP
jgi:hypothetical protein